MKTISISAAVFSLATLLAAALPACSSGGGSADGAPLDEQDVTSANFFVAVGHGLTGGLQVKIANGSKTRCADGKSQGSCAALGVDLSALKLSTSVEKKVGDAFAAGRAIVQGKLSSVHAAPMLVASSVWLGAGAKEASVTDTFYRVSTLIQNGVCLGGACPSAHEQALNSSVKGLDVVKADLTQAGASARELTTASDQLKIGGPGLLVVGINHTLISAVVGSGVTSTSTLVATNFFLPVAAGGASDPSPVATCEIAGGECKSSPLDVTFPAHCQQDFGTASLTGSCQAINQTCCAKAALEPTCEGAGGECKSSPLDVTFPAQCQQDFGTAKIKGKCAAINQTCCAKATPKPTASCEAAGGECKSSPLDVTFPAQCQQDFGTAKLAGSCAAINQTCCAKPAAKTCEALGGECKSSPLDVTFPADCQQDFSTAKLAGTCAAFNQACCAKKN